MDSGSIVLQVRRRIPSVLCASWEVFPVELLESTLIITFINLSLTTLVQAAQTQLRGSCFASLQVLIPLQEIAIWVSSLLE